MARKLIIDTDPGVDDVLAILLALASPEVDLKLLSICFGNTHAASAYGNTLKIYHLLAQEIAKIPGAAERYSGYVKGKTALAVGADEPIGGTKAVAAYFVSFGMSIWQVGEHGRLTERSTETAQREMRRNPQSGVYANR
jgi:inosine-uridine nucleoside N-ribohydrolase